MRCRDLTLMQCIEMTCLRPQTRLPDSVIKTWYNKTAVPPRHIDPQLKNIALVGDDRVESRELGFAPPALVVGKDVVKGILDLVAAVLGNLVRVGLQDTTFCA